MSFLKHLLRVHHLDVLADLEGTLEKARLACGVPGMSVGVVHEGEIIFAKGFGKRNAVDPFTAETLSPIASMTKAFTATAIGELVAEGKMDWDKTPVNKYLPEFETKDPALTAQLTIDDMLSHRTGLSPNELAWMRSKTPRLELIKRIRYLDVPTRPRSSWRYSNIIYAVAGEAAAQVAGLPYEDLVQSKILDPLGMKKSGFSPMEMQKHPDYALPHKAESFEDALKGHFTILPLDPIYMVDAPAGDMFSNIGDLALWARAMLHSGAVGQKQILSEENVKVVQSPHAIVPVPGRGLVNYGLGWVLNSYKGQSHCHHDGGLVGFRSKISLFPESDLAITVLTNGETAHLHSCIPLHIADLLLDLPKTDDWLMDVAVSETENNYKAMEALKISGYGLPRKVEGKPFTHPLTEYTGTYSHPYYGNLTVRLENGTLKDTSNKEQVLGFQYNEFIGTLEHHHYEKFKAVTVDIGVESTSLVGFQTGSDGQVAAFDLVLSPDETIQFKRNSSKKVAGIQN